MPETKVTVTTTGFTFNTYNLLGALIGGVTIDWYAVGRR